MDPAMRRSPLLVLARRLPQSGSRRLENSTDPSNGQPLETLCEEADDFREMSSATSGEARAYFRLRAGVP